MNLIIKEKVSKYLFGDFNFDWFEEEEFNLEDEGKFLFDLKDWVVYGFISIYDFLYDKEEFILNIKFFINYFKIMLEFENNENNIKIINRIINKLEKFYEIDLNDENNWDYIEKKLDYIRYNLVNKLK